MLVKSYKIVDIKRFEIFIEEITPQNGEAIVKIDKLAICKADLRYYLGNRNKRTLDLKYPLRLIHEAIGTVLKDTEGIFSPGEKVALVPNIHHKNCVNPKCAEIGENFCPNVLFASSNFDGFSAEMIVLPSKNLIRIENSDNYFVFCELISVAIAATRRVNINNKSRIAVFGDGIVGYILCAVLKEMFNCTIFAVGKHIEKLKLFTMCDNVYLVDECDILTNGFDVGFECVGGIRAQDAINSILKLVEIGGKLVLTGVSEENTKINTRTLMEKGITLTGSTRSTVKDFEKAVSLLKNNKFKEYISHLISNEIVIKNIDDYYQAFECEANNNSVSKNVYTFL